MKYKFNKEKSTVELQPVYERNVIEDKVKEVVQPISEDLKLVEHIIEDVPEPKPYINKELRYSLDYVVKEGDYIYQICRRFNISFNEFLRLNKDYFSGRNLDYIYPNEIVKVKNLKN